MMLGGPVPLSLVPESEASVVRGGKSLNRCTRRLETGKYESERQPYQRGDFLSHNCD
jgi:hypothetical protein